MVREKHGAVQGAACLQTLIYIYRRRRRSPFLLTYLLTRSLLPLRHPHEYTHTSIAEAQQRQPGVPLQDRGLQSLNPRPRRAQFPALAVRCRLTAAAILALTAAPKLTSTTSPPPRPGDPASHDGAWYAKADLDSLKHRGTGGGHHATHGAPESRCSAVFCPSKFVREPVSTDLSSVCELVASKDGGETTFCSTLRTRNRLRGLYTCSCSRLVASCKLDRAL